MVISGWILRNRRLVIGEPKGLPQNNIYYLKCLDCRGPVTQFVKFLPLPLADFHCKLCAAVSQASWIGVYRRSSAAHLV